MRTVRTIQRRNLVINNSSWQLLGYTVHAALLPRFSTYGNPEAFILTSKVKSFFVVATPHTLTLGSLHTANHLVFIHPSLDYKSLHMHHPSSLQLPPIFKVQTRSTVSVQIRRRGLCFFLSKFAT